MILNCFMCTHQSKVTKLKISQNFVTFSEYMNFTATQQAARSPIHQEF